MKEYKRKPVTIHALTFDELVEYMKSNNAHCVDGIPWSCDFGSHTISHENNDCYLITTIIGTAKMTREDILIVSDGGGMYPCNIGIFNKMYEAV